MSIRPNNRPLLKLTCVLVPLVLFFLSDQVIGYFRQSADPQAHFRFSLPLDSEYARIYGMDVRPDIDKVVVAGFFSGWSNNDQNYALQPTSKDLWELSLHLPPGEIQYKYVVYLKGNPEAYWMDDPLNPNRASDSHGGFNSVLHRPDYALYQLMADIVTLGIFIFLAAFFALQFLMKWLMNQPVSLANTFTIGTLAVVLLSNFALTFYQVFESRNLIRQGVLDAVHQTHLTLKSTGLDFASLPQNSSGLSEVMRQLLWNAQTRVERRHNAVNQITLSDIAVYTPDFSLIHVQSREQNNNLQAHRAGEAGYTSREDYFNYGVFGPLLDHARHQDAIEGLITAHPATTVVSIETPETRFARVLTGFSNMLVPIVENGQIYGYYAVTIQVKLFGNELLRIIMVNLLLIGITLLIAYLLLRTMGRIASANLLQLTDWTKQINQGDFSGEVNITTRDEIEALADNFREMQHSLKISFEKIEQQNFQLNKAAYFDLESGLPNRKKLLSEFREKHNNSLLLLEICNYEQLKNLLGVDVTKEIIKGVIERIESSPHFQDTDSIFRVDPEQLCLVTASTEPPLLESKANSVVLAINATPLSVDNIALNIETCVGICANTREGDSVREQLEKAGMALAEARSQNLPFSIYNHAKDKGDVLKHNIRMIERIRNAIQRERVIPYYQPIVHTASRELVALECLVRIKENENLVLSPYSFLDTAKKAGLYQSISRIMFNKAFEVLNQTNHRLTVNLSAHDIENPQSREFILALLRNNPGVTERLTLEVTETEHIENYDLMRSFIHQVKEHEVKIALDDFGAGYSNFTHLLSLNIDYIKIDGSLIRNLDTDDNAMKITKAIVECARSLGISVVAEYVHNQAISKIVGELEIEYSQGYLFGAPGEFLPKLP